MNLNLNFIGFRPALGLGVREAFTEYFTTPADEFPPVKKHELGQFSGILNWSGNAYCPAGAYPGKL